MLYRLIPIIEKCTTRQQPSVSPDGVAISMHIDSSAIHPHFCHANIFFFARFLFLSDDG